jgi:uncharacterized protein (DUF2126 family)/transglutaminase-like putative cysteine protease
VAATVALEHRTTYRFSQPAVLGPHLVRLRPAPHSRTPIHSYSLRVEPAGHFLNWQQDPFGNHLARLVFPEPVNELDITVNLLADLTIINPFDFFVEDYAEHFPFRYPDQLAADLGPFLLPPEAGDGDERAALQEFLAGSGLSGQHGKPVVQFLAELNRTVTQAVSYSVRMEHGVQAPDETLRRAIGSCRDSAWLLVALARELGLAARFVSGYLVQLAPDVVDPLRPLSQDFTDLHAWAEVFLPGAGWVGMDATSGLFAGEGHIPLAASPHYAEAAPITGTRAGGGTVDLSFSNTVRRVSELPRATRPYRAEQWQDVMALGQAVDARLADDDVRLTMGGEPTFVAAGNTAADEWNIAADGEDKRHRAADLARRLKQRWAPSGVLQHGQGKWYPGEALPRWQIAISWRDDGGAIWTRPDLLDDPWAEPRHAAADGPKLAGRLLSSIAARLGIEPTFVSPVYEDRLAQLVSEAQLPLGTPPATDVAGTGTADARADLIAELDAEDGGPVGWVLPLHRTDDDRRWSTSRWRTRRGRIVLVGGTSPVGMRLPLGSITWQPIPGYPDPSPFEVHPPLLASAAAIAAAPARAVIRDADEAPTTALATESRDGHLFVFLPPLRSAEAGLVLLEVICGAAAELGEPVVLEGYPLPSDARFTSLTVTPDPGVIEVNVQPAASWSELVDITTSLDAAARECGLATEKFALDGTHAGTGGGSHLTLGGRDPSVSPLLRRPSLLISLLTFWQNHPGLSYLFSGRFIGPTSQAPRVDEARSESLYELEIAFAELDRLEDAAGEVRPWTVDRALRHLLTDITGNTHRAEFCIDKLFSPDSDRGRLGLLELRGFEMPPHPQMSLVQALLVRCLVARFWREPYRAPLVRWGTGLHDRFLLPAFVTADLADVVADLNAHGIAFDRAWLEPFLQFRFPTIGRHEIGPVDVELRAAIEPWHVLGEEATGSGTARYVDSSIERIQVRLSGVVAGRHELTCNGVSVPLHPLAGSADLVAGIRFRAWAPPSALHPTIGVHSPLVVEVIDRWSGVPLGGVTYHVVHPAGRAYEQLPVNAGEAEARRDARFVVGGHVDAIPAGNRTPDAVEYPVTLDLRRALPGTGAVQPADPAAAAVRAGP